MMSFDLPSIDSFNQTGQLKCGLKCFYFTIVNDRTDYARGAIDLAVFSEDSG